MSTVYSVKLQQLIDEFQLEKIFIPDDDNILVTRSDLNRPGWLSQVFSATLNLPGYSL